MPALSIKLESPEFKAWNAPFLLMNQFQLLAKLIRALNVNIPPEKDDVKAEILKELELKVISIFNHQMMPAWLALAKSYYPFYSKSDEEQALIEALEKELNIKVKDYESLPLLIRTVFLTKYPKVNSQYQHFIDSIGMVMAKLTAVALSTPSLINNAHQHNKVQFEEAGPSMSNCISPIETILRTIMLRPEIDKSVTIEATSLLLQVKAIKSHFEQITLIQQLERTEKEKKVLQEQIEREEMNHLALQEYQSKEEQQALVKVFQLQRKINQYYNHLAGVLTKSPKDKEASAKQANLIVLKRKLDQEDVLPGERIIRFKCQLDGITKQLDDHRDPMWIRFLRDCLRILAITFSGVAVYRTLTDQPVNFFKPSHGHRFVEEANRITAQQEITLEL